MSQLAWSPHAALLRDSEGAVVGTTWGGTVCWFPRKPSAFAAVSADGRAENVIRCGWCAGCREFDRRRLAKRIAAHYRECKEPLWLVVIACPLREQSRMAAKLHRSRKVTFESAIYRLGADEFAMVVRGDKPDLSDVRALRGFSDSQARHSQPRARSASQARPMYQVNKIRVGRGLRAWAIVTAGMLRPRDDYGEQRNRFYHRGLPRAERESWQVETRGGIARRHEVSSGSARAWRDGVAIYPPEAWRLPRLLKNKGPERRMSRKRGGIATVVPIAVAIASVFPTALRKAVNASPVSSRAAEPRVSMSDRLSDRAAPLQRVGRSESGQAVLPLRVATALSKSTESLVSNESGYRSSLHLGVGRGAGRKLNQADLDAWIARMMAIKRSRDE